MSQSLNTASDRKTSAFQQARAAHVKMIRRGRSFSGGERNCCYLNTGGSTAGHTRFANISAISGFDFPDDGRAITLVDWDQDGDLDIWSSNRAGPQLRFFRNDGARGNHFISLRLIGNGTTTNRDAIGARVELTLSKTESALHSPEPERIPKSIKTLHAGEGFLSQSSKWLHFGLGECEQIASVRVHWPGGAIETFRGAKVDERFLLVQGTGNAQPSESGTRLLAIAPGEAATETVSRNARIRLLPLLNVPDMFFVDLHKELQPLPIGTGKSLLVNLWATWCAPCQAELADLRKHEEALRQCGIEVLALSVDGLGDKRASSASALDTMRKPGFRLNGGFATPDLVRGFQAMHDHLLSDMHDLPVPTSFLIDDAGLLSVIYRGRLNVEDLLEDASFSSQRPADRFSSAAPRPGTLVDHPLSLGRIDDLQLDRAFSFGNFLTNNKRFADAAEQFEQCLQLQEDAVIRVCLGVAKEKQDLLEEAVAQFRKALELDPDFAEAHRNLGVTYSRLNRQQRALEHLQQAVQVQPDYFRAHHDLGLLLNGLDRSEAAVRHLEEALRIQPDQPIVHADLAKVLHVLGRFQESVEHNKQALRLDSSNLQVMNNLAWQLATCAQDEVRNGAQAVKLAEYVANRTQFRKVDVLDTLAAAKAEVGDFAAAVRWQQQAIEILPPEQRANAQQRLDLYEQKMPYRE